MCLNLEHYLHNTFRFFSTMNIFDHYRFWIFCSRISFHKYTHMKPFELEYIQR